MGNQRRSSRARCRRWRSVGAWKVPGNKAATFSASSSTRPAPVAGGAGGGSGGGRQVHHRAMTVPGTSSRGERARLLQCDAGGPLVMPRRVQPCLVFLIALAWASPVRADDFTGRVVGVSDEK